jgi:hypothetical protein
MLFTAPRVWGVSAFFSFGRPSQPEKSEGARSVLKAARAAA